MADIMRPVPFKELLTRIFSEYKENGSIFGIPEKQFYSRNPDRQISVNGETCDTPIGPAAGPHTQLAQNIVVSWLTGGSFIELKTVQIMDRLEIEKPCIDASDEGFNTEWSTEFTLKKAWDEYMKAWMILCLLEELLSPRRGKQGRSFIFNMSVGYDLKGIKEPPMQEFIQQMMDASKNPKYEQYKNILLDFLQSDVFKQAFIVKDEPALFQLVEKISPRMVNGVTLSTMHGCPPDEIESICRYMLEEKNINTFVKLNPTLLGYKRVREILDQCGFNYIQLKETSFTHDLQLTQALEMLQRLITLSKEKQLVFGVKLTNTLGTINHKNRLPGEEMYMSGRALFPISINVAAVLSRHFDGKLPISYSGGASQFNIADIFATGIQPITMATDLLKPGGYLRMAECAHILENSAGWEMKQINVDLLNTLAEKALTASYIQKEWKSRDEIDTGEKLPLTDCFVAPCVTACAIKQDIPEYIRLAGEGRYVDALELIYQRNALPAITGHICDHQCQYNCTRLDYEQSLNIREIKKIVVEKGFDDYKARWYKPAGSGSQHPVAVIGAGPAGLAAGYFLARAGHQVTLFDKEKDAGGVVNNIIPRFRIPESVIRHDIDFVAEHGVKFEFNCGENLTIDQLHQQGFKYVCVAVGAHKNTGLSLTGDNKNVMKSFDFLRAFNQGTVPFTATHVAVVGAGNTAMDCARAALRLPGVKTVTILYRRTRDEMPAWPEEVKEAEEDGVKFRFLVSPEIYTSDGSLTVRLMKLGEPDEKNRRRPVATDQIEILSFDALITAIGEQPNYEQLAQMGVPVADDGKPVINEKTLETSRSGVYLIGDVQTGPLTIVSAIGGARRATDHILQQENIRTDKNHKRWLNTSPESIYARKGLIATIKINSDDQDAFAKQEAARCLECNYVCSKCVDVCPNRANVSIMVPGFKSRHQILHIDAYCNECDNCAQFCPWQGKPYKDKLTIFNLSQDFVNSTNSGFLVEDDHVRIRYQQQEWRLPYTDTGIQGAIPEELAEISKLIGYVQKNHGYLLNRVEE